MANVTINDLTNTAVTATNADLLHLWQSSVAKKMPLNVLAEFVLRNSDFADQITTLIADIDYTAAQLEPDRRIFVNPTAGDVTVGFFNGSTRDGAVVVIKVVGTANNAILELVSTGVTDYTLDPGDSFAMIWDDTNSEWLVLYADVREQKLTPISTSQTANSLQKYFSEDTNEVTLPTTANKGDVLEVFAETVTRIIQGDAENAIAYLNKYFTTKGTAGYLELPSKSKVELVYQGVGLNRVEPGVKISDPATSPTGTPEQISYTFNDLYCAVGHQTTPFITIYKIAGDTYTKLADPAVIPTAPASPVFSFDSVYLGCGVQGTPNLVLYKRSGDTFTKIADPATMPVGAAYRGHFSYDGNYYAVTHLTTPFVTIYSINKATDVFTKLANPGTLPTGTARACKFSYDGNYLAVAHDVSPYITIYKRNGDTFTKVTNPGTLPTGTARDCAFSYDNKFLAIAHLTSPYITIYEIDPVSDTFTKLPDPSVIPGMNAFGCDFSYDNKYLAVAFGASPFIRVYKISGDTFTVLTNPATLPGSTGFACKFSSDTIHLGIGYAVPPWVSFWKNAESANKLWQVKDFNTLYELDKEYMFQ